MQLSTKQTRRRNNLRPAQLAGWALLGAALACAQLAPLAEAGQGCPFDDGSCQEYCSQQGCNMGYCGHFAWIQCICRKCGDEWSWYDKVRYNPDQTVNQTELDSLKLNATTPLVLSNSSAGFRETNKSRQAANAGKATLVTLLIPDLSSDSGNKLDLNDIPDENSDKFLDYLAKNHEKLVQATSARNAGSAATSEHLQLAASALRPPSGDQDDEASAPTTGQPGAGGGGDDETVEIQISTSNNAGELAEQPQRRRLAAGAGQPNTRLLKMTVDQRAPDDID